MSLHENLTGSELHYPLGRGSSGALELEDDTSAAYSMVHSTRNQLNVSTITGSEAITVGNSTTNPDLLVPGSGDVGLGTESPTSPNGNAKAVQITGTSVGLVLDSTNGSGVPWEIQHNSGDMKLIYDGANTLGGGAKTAIALDATGAMRLGAEVATPSAPASGAGGFVYIKSDGLLYYISDSIGETDLTAGGGGSPPFTDTGGICKGSADATKIVAIECDTYISSGTTRTITMADENIDLRPNDGSFAESTTAQSVAAGTTTLSVINRFVKCDTSSDVITINLPAAATAGTGAFLIIKDGSGDAATNNITVDADGAETIDGQLTATIDQNWGSLKLITDGTSWYIE